MDFAPKGIGQWLMCLAFAAWLLLLLLKLADRARGKSPMPPNEQLHQSHEQLMKDHRETRARVIEIEKWRLSLPAQLTASNEPILEAGKERYQKLEEKMEDVRKELDGKIGKIQEAINDMPEAIVQLFTNIKRLGE